LVHLRGRAGPHGDPVLAGGVMATVDDEPLHITRACPHCGHVEKISHADLVAMMHQMAQAVSARVLSARAKVDPPGWQPEEAVRVAVRARVRAARAEFLYSLAWVALIAFSFLGAALALLTGQASPALLIVSNLTTALIAFVVWAFVLPTERRRR